MDVSVLEAHPDARDAFIRTGLPASYAFSLVRMSRPGFSSHGPFLVYTEPPGLPHIHVLAACNKLNGPIECKVHINPVESSIDKGRPGWTLITGQSSDPDLVAFCAFLEAEGRRFTPN